MLAVVFFFSLYVSKILRMGQQDPGNEHTHHSIDRRWDWSTCTACCTGSQPTKSRDRTTFRSWQILEYRRKEECAQAQACRCVRVCDGLQSTELGPNLEDRARGIDYELDLSRTQSVIPRVRDRAAMPTPTATKQAILSHPLVVQSSSRSGSSQGRNAEDKKVNHWRKIISLQAGTSSCCLLLCSNDTPDRGRLIITHELP